MTLGPLPKDALWEAAEIGSRRRTVKGSTDTGQQKLQLRDLRHRSCLCREDPAHLPDPLQPGGDLPGVRGSDLMAEARRPHAKRGAGALALLVPSRMAVLPDRGQRPGGAGSGQ